MSRIKYIVIALLLLSAPAFAADHYVSPTGTGTESGEDWNNTLGWDALSGATAFVRGDTYYLADGDYGAKTLDDAVNGTAYIYIKKATAASHGAVETGWDNTMGDGVASFTAPIHFRSSYWDWDGVVGSGPGTVAYGFKVSYTGSCSNNQTKVMTAGYLTQASNIRIQHTDIEHCGYSYTGGQDCLMIGSGASTTTSNIYVAYNWMHNVNRVHIYNLYAKNITIEHNWFTERFNHNNLGVHGEAFTMYGNDPAMGQIYRYNFFRNVEGTGIIVIQDTGSGGYDIYGNVFYCDGAHVEDGWTDNNAANTPTTANLCNTTNGALADTGAFTNTDINIYNNTFVDLNGNAGQGINNVGNTNVVLRNNLWVNSGTPATSGTTVSNNETAGATSLFTDYAGHDYTLASATDNGYSLSSPYNSDLLGNIRGADGTWDLGAYEYTGVDASPPVRSNGSPSGTLSAGTTSVAMTLTTNETATCKYGTVADTAYASISDTFTATGATSHSQTIGSLVNGTTYTYYVRCTDATPNVNTDDYTITWSVANPPPPDPPGDLSITYKQSAPAAFGGAWR